MELQQVAEAKRRPHTDPQKLKLVLLPGLSAFRLPSLPSTHHTTFSLYCVYPAAKFPLYGSPNQIVPRKPALSMPASRTREDEKKNTDQPPRPPNAWIIYRSDMIRRLPSITPGTARRPQADISKQISQMWRNESEDVRAQYEYMANIKKSEHQALYPNYRFQPMKRADKERLREEKKAEKERERAELKKGRSRPVYASGMVTPVAGPSIPVYSTEMRYGPGGPSPPISAAPSPAPADPSVVSSNADTTQLEHSSPRRSTHASPGSQLHSTGPSECAQMPLDISDTSFGSQEGSAPDESSTQSITTIVAPQASSRIQLPQVAGWEAPGNLLGSAYNDSMSIWADPSASQNLFEQQNESYEMQELLQFTMPHSWNPDELSGDFQQYNSSEFAHAFISGTNDPNVYQLSTLDPGDLLQAPSSCEIEVSMTNAFAPYASGNEQVQQSGADQFSGFNNLFLNQFDNNQFDINNFAALSSSSSDVTSSDGSARQIAPVDSDAQSLSVDNLSLLPQQGSQQSASIPSLGNFQDHPLELSDPPSSTYSFQTPSSAMDPTSTVATSYNFGGLTEFQALQNYHPNYPINSQAVPTMPHPSPPQSSAAQQSHSAQGSSSSSSSSSYVPPAGAAQSSMRRAAASWKPSFSASIAMTDEDHSAPDGPHGRQLPAWGVPASAS